VYREAWEGKGNVERPLFKAKSSELLAYLDWDWLKWPPQEAGAVSVADSLTGSFWTSCGWLRVVAERAMLCEPF
jgi:hypothetical protein